MNKAIFLDRDGTINVDFGYVCNPEKLVFVEGVENSLKRLLDAGYMLIVITNQSGVGRGYFTEQEAKDFNTFLSNKLEDSGICITDFFMCVHSPNNDCDCRKPSPKLILEAIKKYNIDATLSFMLGDKESDVQSGRNAGLRSMLITEKEDIVYWTDYIIGNNE
jgi:D-glycero-D-manno-heptose 1,7-bisphosphate phosphatase